MCKAYTVVMCQACGERVAEIIVDKRRSICSECHLRETRTERHKEKERTG